MNIKGKTIDGLNRVIGYRLCPARIWTYGELPNLSFIAELANGSISGVLG